MSAAIAGFLIGSAFGGFIVWAVCRLNAWADADEPREQMEGFER